jgi:rare lipoprotein A
MRFRLVAAAALLMGASPSPSPQTGEASYYADSFEGKKTANGERFSQQDMTAASKTLPLGSTAKVTNLNNGKSVKVRINDRGPYAKHRIVDVSKTAAKKLEMKEEGKAPVKVQPLTTPTQPPQ